MVASRSTITTLELSNSVGTNCLQTTSRNCSIYFDSVLAGKESLLVVLELSNGGGRLSISSILILACDMTGDVGERGLMELKVFRRGTSSKRGKTTMFGSPCKGIPSMADSLPKLLASDNAIDPRRNGDNVSFRMSGSSEYSGRCWKLSGLTTTLYVPGLERSAFRSRSSSVTKA